MSKTHEVHHIELPFTSRGVISILLNLIYLRRFRKGIFHISGDVHYAMLALPPERTILTIHDLVFLHTYTGIRRRILKWLFLDLPIQRARYITTISEKSKQEIILHGHCNPDKIIVIPNPVETSFRHEAKDFSQVPTCLFLGTKPNKNLELSIAALFQLPIRLHIIGELSFYQKELLAKFGINYIHESGLSQEALVSAYLGADFILFPSTYEGFGLPVIEGFQSGRCVITSNIQPMSDVAKDAALLVDPGSIIQIRNAVKRICEDEQLRIALVNKGIRQVEKHQVNMVAATYMSLWGQLNTH